MELLFHAIIIVNIYFIEIYILLCNKGSLFQTDNFIFPL